MFKVVNKRSENTYQKKISTTNTYAEGANEEKRKIQIGVKPFQIVGRAGIKRTEVNMIKTKRCQRNHRNHTTNVLL